MANGVRLSVLRNKIRRRHKTFRSEAVREAWRRSPASALGCHLFDRKYRTVPEDVWKLILKHSGIDRRKYVNETRDCDDFAFALRGAVPLELGVNGIGCVIDFSAAHAYTAVLVVDDAGELQVRFVEPQNDAWVTPGTEMYKLEDGYALF